MHELCCDECGKTVAYTDDETIFKLAAKSARLVCPPCNDESDTDEGEDE